MRAIIETGGKQFAVAPEKTIRVPSIAGEPGDEVTFDRVLYIAGGSAAGDPAAGNEDGGFHVGSPLVEGGRVTAEIVRQGRGKKIRIFKYKRRKRYRRRAGHRQNFTELRVTDIAVGQSETFTCEECGKEYKTERGLAQHRAKAHAE